MRLGPDASDFSFVAMSSGYDHPRPADIIFVGIDTKSLANAGQALVRKGYAEYSHVALNYTGETCLHSMPKNGVGFDPIQDIVFQDGKYKNFRVFRYKAFEERDIRILYDRMVSLTAPFFGKPYNFAIFIDPKIRFLIRKKSADNSFCSEFVSNFFTSIGVAVSDKIPANTLPSDIISFVSRHENEWADVTDIYIKYFADCQHESEIDVRTKIQQKQMKSLSVALSVRRGKIDKFVKLTDKHLKDRLSFTNRFLYKDIDFYPLIRSSYFDYRRAAYFSMSYELLTSFSVKRAGLLRRIKRLRKSRLTN
jgi:hypothetical protein